MAVACVTASAQSAEGQLAQVIAALMMPAGSEGSYGDWQQIESVKEIRWEPLPPKMLDDALPDGAYFTRRGLANLGGRPFGVVATGARTMVINVYFRNVSASPVGEAAVVAELQRQGFSLDLARRRQGQAARVLQLADGLQRLEMRGVRAAAERDTSDDDAAAAAALHGSLHR
jgi:hypothetical protein